MSTFRREMTVVLDGEPFKVRTSAQDNINAEVMLSKMQEAGPLTERTQAMGILVAFCGFRRTYPDHELAQGFARFRDVLDEMQDAELEDTDAEGDPLAGTLDPTRTADGDA